MQRNTKPSKTKIVKIQPKQQLVEIKDQSMTSNRKIPLLAKSSLRELIKRYKNDSFRRVPFTSGPKAKLVIQRLETMLAQKGLSDETIIDGFKCEQQTLEKSSYVTHINQFLNEVRTPFYKINQNLLKKISDYLYSTDLANASAASLFFHGYFSSQNTKRFGTGKNYLKSLWDNLTIKITLPDKTNPPVSEIISCVQTLGEQCAIGTITGTIYISDQENISVKENKIGEINFQSILTLNGHKSAIKNIVLHPNQSYWISHASAHQFCIWDRQHELKKTHEFKRTTATDFQENSHVLSNGQIAFMQSNDIKIYEYHLQKNELIHLHTITESLNPQKIYALTDVNGYIIDDRSSLPSLDRSDIYSIIFQGDKKQVAHRSLQLCNLLSNNNLFTNSIRKISHKNNASTYKIQSRVLNGKTLESYPSTDSTYGDVYTLPSGYYFTASQNTEAGFTISFYQDKKIKKSTLYLGEQIYFFGCGIKFFTINNGNIFTINAKNETAILSYSDRKKIINDDRLRLQLELDEKSESNKSFKI